MRRKEDHPLKKHTLNLYEGDFDRLIMLYDRLGAGKVVRTLVRAHLRKIDAQAAQFLPEIDLPLPKATELTG